MLVCVTRMFTIMIACLSLFWAYPSRANADWTTFEGRLFTVRSELSTTDTAQFVHALDQTYATIMRRLPRGATVTSDRCTVYVFQSKDDFLTFASDGVDATCVYRPKSSNPKAYPDRVLATFYKASPDAVPNLEGIARGCAFAALHAQCAGPAARFFHRPAWWIQGVAAVFGSGRRNEADDRTVLDVSQRHLTDLQQHLRVSSTSRPVALSTVLRARLSSTSNNYGIPDCYFWGFTYYLLHRAESAATPTASFVTPRPITIDTPSGPATVDLGSAVRDFWVSATSAPPEAASPSDLSEHYLRELQAALGVQVDWLGDDWRKFILELKSPH